MWTYKPVPPVNGGQNYMPWAQQMRAKCVLDGDLFPNRQHLFFLVNACLDRAPQQTTRYSSPHKRTRIATMYNSGTPTRVIASKEGISRGSVYSTSGKKTSNSRDKNMPRKKKCFICEKEGCWSTNHKPSEFRKWPDWDGNADSFNFYLDQLVFKYNTEEALGLDGDQNTVWYALLHTLPARLQPKMQRHEKSARPGRLVPASAAH
ncbi:hypothetical protein XA68_13702 [Ophiocordyceps unilateralis]|uniref:Uncharacterized protein n=1 Tax=Ophiocordyceps unilateralis TaxID=268505 RepID=A0A2A9PC73_OPHUN|nr:hypothetical protein XA68_13702 [Ophiocordyceps unilateralis]